MRERRRLGELARDHADLAALEPGEDALEPLDVHRLVQAVDDRLRDERMVGNLDVAGGEVLAAGDLIGKDRRQQVLGVHALQLRCELPPAAEAQERERAVAFQRQRVANIGASSSAWTSSGAYRLRAADTERRPRARSCGWSTSDRTIASSVAAACSSKLNLRQNRLRSASPHARLMRLPNGAWITSCMPPDSSKKRSSTTVFSVGSAPSAARAAAR